MPYPCPICNDDLYEAEAVAVCTFCGRQATADYLCPNGHFICEDCRLAEFPQVIEWVCTHAKETNPGTIVNLLMKHPAVLMHSPQHHLLVAPAVIAALAASGQMALKPGRLSSAIKRTRDIPFAVCGTRGECGAAASVGALVSILTGATYRKGAERALALRATAAALEAIAEAGGPRCCKQSVYLSLEVAARFLERELNMHLPLSIQCEFAARNPECKKELCRYYDGV